MPSEFLTILPALSLFSLNFRKLTPVKKSKILAKHYSMPSWFSTQANDGMPCKNVKLCCSSVSGVSKLSILRKQFRWLPTCSLYKRNWAIQSQTKRIRLSSYDLSINFSNEWKSHGKYWIIWFVYAPPLELLTPYVRLKMKWLLFTFEDISIVFLTTEPEIFSSAFRIISRMNLEIFGSSFFIECSNFNLNASQNKRCIV